MKTKILYGEFDNLGAWYRTNIDEVDFDGRRVNNFRPGSPAKRDGLNNHGPLPETIVMSGQIYIIKRGKITSGPGKVPVVISDEYVDQLDAMDARVAALMDECRDLMGEAVRRGRPLTVDEVKAGALNEFAKTQVKQ